MNRNDIFLDAMGLGPQWRLRNAPAGLAMADDEVMAAGVDPAAAHAHAEAAQFPGDAGLADNMQGTRPGAPQPAGAAAVAGQPPEPAPALPAEVPPPAAGRGAGDIAPASVDRQARPGTPAVVQAGDAPAGTRAAAPAPSSAAGDEDTSWFDDAPAAPAARPALKSSAPAKAPPPAKAAPEAGTESYAWFDDVPATPISKAPRAPEREAEPEAGDAAQWHAQAAPTAPRPAGRPATRQAAPADDIPWFDDAPMPSFDALPDDIPFDGQYGEEEAGVSAAAIARMDWPALRAAVQACTRCGLCRERGAAVPGHGPAQAPWLVLGTAPAADDEAQARPLAGAPGQLLDNMLKAIDVAPGQDAYVTTLVKCRPQGDRAPTADEIAACRPYLEREIALAGTRAAVTLGHTAAKGLLGAAARGKVLRLQQIPVVATYHPADLLRKPEDKARAWADLCLARSAFDGR